MVNDFNLSEEKTIVDFQQAAKHPVNEKVLPNSEVITSSAWQPESGMNSLSVFENNLNPLLAAAQPLLSEMVQLQVATNDKPLQLYRQQLGNLVENFTKQLGRSGIDAETLIYARYVMCTVVDEMVNKSDWEGRHQWSQQSLLAQYHGETGGGEKFFDLLNYLLMHPAKQLAMLELMFVCINMGFEGKYHLIQRGHVQLQQITANLFQAIRLQRGAVEEQLSDHWLGVKKQHQALKPHISVWTLLAITVALLFSMHAGFNHFIKHKADIQAEKILTLPTQWVSPAASALRDQTHVQSVL